MMKKLLVATSLLCLFTMSAQSAEMFTDFSDPFTPDFGKSNVAPGMRFGSLSIFTSQGDFENAADATNKRLKFVEDFEENNVGQLGIATLVSPLAPGVPNLDGFGLGFPNGLAAQNIQITTPDGGPLVVLGDLFIGNNTSVVGANSFANSTVIDVLDDRKTAIGFNVLDPIGGTGDYDVTVLDTGGGVLFAGTISAGANPGSFMGFVAGAGSIGSIEIGAALDGGELLDNIQLWVVPEPAAAMLGLVSLLGLVGCRRR